MNLDRPDLALFANLVFAWSFANYFPLGDADATHRPRVLAPVLRAVAMLVTAWAAAGIGGWRIAVPMAVATGIMLALRERLPKRYLAELELMNAPILIGALALVRHWRLATNAVVEIKAESNTVPAALLILSIVCYSLRGGSYVVRGLLEKGALIPVSTAASTEKRVQHGRMIGYLERVIVIAAVTAGSYEALAFLMAAKGLIRAKELEDRAFAEYFLVGSLASTLVALLAGMLISWIAATVPTAKWASLFL